VFWIGGSSISYNYNGVAYNGSGGVEPSYTIARYDAQYQDWHEGTGAPFGLMDLRGIGQVSSTSWIICGGMEDGQQVSKRTFLLAYDPLVGGLINEEFEIKVIDYQVQNAAKFDELILLDLQGKFVEKISTEDGLMERRETGLYILNGMIEGKRVAMKLVIP
jgi:hypothetical protein